MKAYLNKFLERCRLADGPWASDASYGFNGKFVIPARGQIFTVIVSDGGGWDHVSVSLPGRCPTWDEMCEIKSLFFRDDECVMELHPPQQDYVNYHPFCLHLWRPQAAEIPRPPSIFVGPLAAR